MLRTRTRQHGYTLIEMLIVVALVGVLTALVLPSFEPSLHDRLQASARLIAGDLAAGRSLALTHNSHYRFRFRLTENRYVLEHSGTNTALNTLPPNPLGSPYDTATQRIVDLDEVPGLDAAVHLAGLTSGNPSMPPPTEIEFGPMGQTTQPATTIVWLWAGSGARRRFISVSINHVTGLATVGDFQATTPTGLTLTAASTPITQRSM